MDDFLHRWLGCEGLQEGGWYHSFHNLFFFLSAFFFKMDFFSLNIILALSCYIYLVCGLSLLSVLPYGCIMICLSILRLKSICIISNLEQWFVYFVFMVREIKCSVSVGWWTRSETAGRGCFKFLGNWQTLLQWLCLPAPRGWDLVGQELKACCGVFCAQPLSSGCVTQVTLHTALSFGPGSTCTSKGRWH